jgi:hypothetical protein
MTGESPLDPGPTFDELKTIVADPEWRDDPDEKATTVAMECVQRKLLTPEVHHGW